MTSSFYNILNRSNSYKTLISVHLVKQAAFITQQKCLTSAAFNTKPLINSNIYQTNVETRRYRRGKWKTWPTGNLPIEWQRPPVKDCKFETGDRVKNIGEIDVNMPKPFFENCKELESADEQVKKIFTLATGRQKEIMYQKMRDAIKKFQREEYDSSSMDVKVAILTLKIRNLQEFFSSVDYEKVDMKRALIEFVGKRYKYLNQIRKFDKERFNYLVQELEIDFEEPRMDNPPLQYTRKRAIKQLVEEHCAKVKKDKLDAYKKVLQEQQDQFLKEKEEMERWIEAEQQAIADYEMRTNTKLK